MLARVVSCFGQASKKKFKTKKDEDGRVVLPVRMPTTDAKEDTFSRAKRNRTSDPLKTDDVQADFSFQIAPPQSDWPATASLQPEQIVCIRTCPSLFRNMSSGGSFLRVQIPWERVQEEPQWSQTQYV